jgi:hypothetical protein
MKMVETQEATSVAMVKVTIQRPLNTHESGNSQPISTNSSLLAALRGSAWQRAKAACRK